MSTPAMYGYRENDEDHIFHCKADGYPGKLGVEVAKSVLQPTVINTEILLEQVYEFDLDYGYVLNYDTKMLEFYTAARSGHPGTGRFTGSREMRSQNYGDPDRLYTVYGLNLVKEIPFTTIITARDSELPKLFAIDKRKIK